MKFLSQYKGLRRELYILLIGRMMTNMGSMVWPMFTLILNGKLGLDATTIALCFILYGIVSIPLTLAGGKLADRFNKRNIIVLCDLVSIASFIYCSAVPISISAILIFAVASLFQAVEWPSYDALVADFSTPENREKAYSLNYLGSNLGLVLSPTIGGLLFKNHLNLAFLINGLAIAFSTVFIFFGIKDVHRESSTGRQGIYEAEIDKGLSAVKWVLTSRVAVVFIASSAIAGSVYSMYNYLMPLDLGAIYPENGSLIFGSMSSVNCLVVIVFTALLTSLFSKVREAGRMILGETLIFLGFLVFVLLAGRPIFCYVAIVIFTWGEILNAISASPFISKRIPASHRGRITSIQHVAGSIIAGVVQFLIGSTYDNFGSYRAWAVVLGLSAVSISLLAVMSAWDRKDFRALYE